MSLNINQNTQESPLENNGDFIWAPDVRWNIQEILEVNEWDYDEQIMELISSKYCWAGEWFIAKSNWDVTKTFWLQKFIRLLKKGDNELVIDMIQLEWDGIKAMLEIIAFWIENNYKVLSGKVQPQQKSSLRRKKILYDFYSNFWFSWNDGTNLSLVLSDENKRVMVNKIKYFLEKWKWFRS